MCAWECIVCRGWKRVLGLPELELRQWELPIRVLGIKAEFLTAAPSLQPKVLKYYFCPPTAAPWHWDMKPHAIGTHRQTAYTTLPTLLRWAFHLGPWQQVLLKITALFVNCVNKTIQVVSGKLEMRRALGVAHTLYSAFILHFFWRTHLALLGQWEKSWTNGNCCFLASN